jgi:hypothetical protein
MSACGHSSWGNQDKATSCMKSKEGYSDGCATCFGATIACTASKCMTKCIAGETAACKQCVADNCNSALETCSGLTPPTFALQYQGGTNCTDTQDRQIWERNGRSSFISDMSKCASDGDQTKAASCLQKKETYTAQCSAALGESVACYVKTCKQVPTCWRSKCAAGFQSTTGLDIPPPPPQSTQSVVV